MATFSTIGQSVPRLDGSRLVSGAGRYTADYHPPGTLWARLLRSAEPHARLVGVDASRARALPGVHAVLTGADTGGLHIGSQRRDWPLLALDRVRFVGDPIAAVAAEDLDTADEAIHLVEVEYEPLPGVFDARAALRDDAPLLHPDIRSYHGPPPPSDVPNLQGAVAVGHGDVEQGFAEADLVFEHTFTTERVHQCYLEPRGCLVQPEADGTVRVWSSCKDPYKLRDLLVELFQLAAEQVVVEHCYIGGDFGSKGDVWSEPVAYLLARATGRPVKLLSTYTEELLGGYPRHAAHITVRTGVMRDGRILAREMQIAMDGGAYAAPKYTPNVILPSVTRGLGPYRIPHTRLEARFAYTNTVPCGAMRAPAQPQVVFAGESQLDVIAEALGLDPLELRRRNVIQEGDVLPDNTKYDGVMADATLRLVQEASGWDAPLGPDRGRGVAITERGIPSAPSGVVLTAHPDGTVTALNGCPDIGTGSFTVLAQIVAEDLGLPLEAVKAVSGNTSQALLDAGTGGSKATYSISRAALEAARALNEQLGPVAADLLECAVDDLERAEHAYRVKGQPSPTVPVAQVVAEAARRAGGALETSAPGPGRGREVTQPCFVASVVEVAVDRETGRVTPQRITTALDVGTAINPLLLQGQVDGATVQGLGMAVMEHLESEEGHSSTLNLGEYKIPCMADLPPLKSAYVEGAPGPAPYQAKAVGELANCAVPAALASAVAQAVGARVTSLPITAEKVWAALGRPQAPR